MQRIIILLIGLFASLSVFSQSFCEIEMSKNNKKEYEKAKALRKDLASDVESRLLELSEAEKQGVTDPDIPADIFGRLLGSVFKEADNSLYRFGYTLGRFIYLCDAVCDFKSDISTGGTIRLL